MNKNNNTQQRLCDAAIGLIWKSSYGSASVEDICQLADVQKGSFYHFFDSKAELIKYALEQNWQLRQQEMRRIFAPSVPPLKRIEDYFQHVYKRQVERKKAMGQAPGCLHGAVGLECARLEPSIRRTVANIAAERTVWFEQALRDAVEQGVIAPLKDVPGLARTLFCLLQGGLMQARIENKPAAIRDLVPAVLVLVGAQSASRPARGSAAAKTVKPAVRKGPRRRVGRPSLRPLPAFGPLA